MSSNEVSIEIPFKSCLNYYSVEDFKPLNISTFFNIFHTNINGLESKLDQMARSKTWKMRMDIVALTETSEKEDIGFIGNVEIDGLFQIL